MALTDLEMQKIRDEEFFRAAVAKELLTPKPATTLLERISDFLETKAGYWILTTFLAGGVSAGFTYTQTYMHRDEAASKVQAESSRRDAEIIMKLAPLLYSTSYIEASAAIGMFKQLLKHLAEKNGIDKSLAETTIGMLNDIVARGKQAGASPEQIKLGETADRALTVSTADNEKISALPQAQSNIEKNQPLDLPIRMYMHIAQDSQSELANSLATLMRNKGILVPSIEMVTKGIPIVTDLRYCPRRIAPGALESVQNLLKNSGLAIKLIEIKDGLCEKIRLNQFELWFAQ